MQVFSRIFWRKFSSVVSKIMILVHLRCYFRSEKRHNLCFLVCKIFYPKIRSCKNVAKFHVCNAAFFPSIMRCAKQYFRHCLPSQSLSTLPSNMRTIYFLCLPVFTICPQDLKYNMIGLTVILSGSLSFYLGSYVQGCISCGILVSGIRARGVSSEHMENMEMFSCSPT